MASWPIVGRLTRQLGLFNLRWDPSIFIHDLTTPFPWADDCAEVIYSSHTLEHLDRAQGQEFLTQCFRVLRPGGVIRIVVPDLAFHVERYSKGTVPADSFLEDLDVLYGAGKSGMKRWLAPFVQYPHKCMYDQKALLIAMHRAGFACEPRRPFDSRIMDIESIELAGRTDNSVIVEGLKPAGLSTLNRQ